MKAYILAAGYGTRLYPVTRDIPKGLLEVGGQPILSRLFHYLRKLEGLSEIVIVTNARFFDRFREWCDGQEPGVPVTLLNDGTTSNEDRMGAVRDLKLAVDHVPLGGEDALVMASDHLFELDLGRVQREFRERGHSMIVVRPVEPTHGPSRYSEVTLDSHGRVLRFREKPMDHSTELAAIALYMFRGEDLGLLAEYLRDGNPDAPGYFLSWLVQKVPCYATHLDGGWWDIGSPESLEEARSRWG